MANFKRNVLTTASIVVSGTILTGLAAAILVLAVMAASSNYEITPPLLQGLWFFTIVGVVAALVSGLLFSVVTLFVAAITLPAVLGFIRLLDFPRPATDMIGGAMAGYVCAPMALLMTQGFVPYGTSIATAPQIFAGVSVVGGAVAGLVRYVVLKPERSTVSIPRIIQRAEADMR